MATLTETAAATKKLLKIIAIGFGVFFFFKFSLFIFNTYLTVAKPEPVAPATVAFGKLPPIEFPEKLHPEITLRLETPTGGTPNLGDRAEVYLMPTFRSNFLALEEAKATAKKMGFNDLPKEITERRYRFEAEDFLPSVLEMDIINGSFLLKRNWQADPTILTDKQLPGKEQALVSAKGFLSEIGLFNEELGQAKIEVTYLTFIGGQYQPAVSLSEADFTQIDIFRPDINQKPVLPQDPTKGIVRIIFSGSPEAAKQIIQAEYNYFPVNLNESATYPIKTASQAWREMQTKQGFIASLGKNNSDVIAIRRIYLAYFDGEVSNGFMTPIIVFEGDNGFFGYAQAITNEWLADSPTKNSQTPN